MNTVRTRKKSKQVRGRANETVLWLAIKLAEVSETEAKDPAKVEEPSLLFSLA